MEIVTGLIYTPETASEHFQVSLSKFNFPIKNRLSFFKSKVANYGIGGLYKTHTDSTVNREDTDPWMLHIGDRIATLMVYVI